MGGGDSHVCIRQPPPNSTASIPLLPIQPPAYPTPNEPQERADVERRAEAARAGTEAALAQAQQRARVEMEAALQVLIIYYYCIVVVVE